MTWTYTKDIPGFSNGQIHQRVFYSQDAPVDTFERTYFCDPPVPPDDWPDSIARAITGNLNALDTSKLAAGSPTPAPIVKPPTADQVALSAFLALLNDASSKWDEFRDARTQGVPTKLQQSDVDAAMVAWKLKYSDAYAPFLVGKFL